MSGILFLLASLIGLWFAVTAVHRPNRNLRVLGVPWFLAGLVGGELAIYHLAWQAAATLLFVGAGALETGAGVLGLVVTMGSWILLGVAHGQTLATRGQLRASLREGWPELALQDATFAPRDVVNPFRRSWPGVARSSDIPYAKDQPRDPGDRNLLDVYRPTTAAPPGGAARHPILVQIHGGAWIVGHKAQQALPLMNHMAAEGWVVFAPNYRLSPRATWPDHVVDVKRAIAWIREHALEYSADPDFICITGGSAGGHLTALAALTANDPAFQPGFEEADTRLAAAVPYYGVFDFLDRDPVRSDAAMRPFLESRVFKSSPESERHVWEAASPLDRIHPDAPPFFVIQGTHDTLVFAEESRTFVERLRAQSKSRVVHLELPGAQHAFDVFNTVRTAHTTRAVAQFLARVHEEHLATA